MSLGKCRELLDADYDAHKLSSGYQSVKGLGKMAPDPAHNYVLYVHTVNALPVVTLMLEHDVIANFCMFVRPVDSDQSQGHSQKF